MHDDEGEGLQLCMAYRIWGTKLRIEIVWVRWEKGIRMMTDERCIDVPYHDQKAIMKPNHEKKNVRPYVVEIGLKKGIDRAFWLTGLTSGARQRSEKVSILKVVVLMNSPRYPDRDRSNVQKQPSSKDAVYESD
jgi:hypothetical protein